tara:strand:+ start:1286 stop:1678 length:393 start_codon:yes stop_codon:yes gene_type:complete
MQTQSKVKTSNTLAPVANAINNLFTKWKLSQQQRMQLLGFTSTSMLHRFENTPEKLTTRPDLEMRLSLLLNIHQSLRMLFSNPENVYGYMSMVNGNAPFNGQKPVDIACHDVVGLIRVHDALDGMRGGMW